MFLPQSANVFKPAEHERPWLRPICDTPFGGTLPLDAEYSIRVIDNMSQGCFDPESGRIEAADCTTPLDTEAERRAALKVHVNWKDWSRDTQFISADPSEKDSLDQARDRLRKKTRGDADDIYLVLINHNARVRAGAPLLNAMDEMQYYGVSDPYDRDFLYYKRHILLPYVVTPDEVAGVWAWAEIQQWMEDNDGLDEAWIDQVLRPAFRQHEAKALATCKQNDIAGREMRL